jgi:hypothetical protein
VKGGTGMKVGIGIHQYISENENPAAAAVKKYANVVIKPKGDKKLQT